MAAGDTFKAQGVINTIFSAEHMQDMVRVLSDSVSTHFRRFGRVELLVYYGLAIFFGFVIQGILGRFLRSYRFEFLPREGVVERREMWLFTPGWAGVWVATALLMYLVVNTTVTWTIRLPVWGLFGVVGAGIAGWILWAWAPGVLEGKSLRVRRWKVRISLWLLVLPALAVALMVVGAACGWHARVGIAGPCGFWRRWGWRL